MSSIVSTSIPPPPGNIALHDAPDPEFSGTKLMICAIITLCLALTFLSLLRLNGRWQWWTNPNPSAHSQEGAFTTNPILRRMRMAALMNEARIRGDENTMNHGRLSSSSGGGGQPDLESNLGPLTREGYGCPSTTCRGLDRAAIDTLPTFCAGSSGDDAELCCAVCLCEFQADEKGRILPLCLHRFHVVCIDLWLASHPTCPVCRRAAMVLSQPNPSPPRPA